MLFKAIATLVMALCLAIMFIAWFFGFIVSDNTDSRAAALISSIVPGAALAVGLEAPLVIVLWFATFWSGYWTAKVLNQ
jgi:hypothetical protein